MPQSRRENPPKENKRANPDNSHLLWTTVRSVPVCRCGEDAEDDVTAVHVYDGTGGVQHVEVEVGISRHGAVESGLQEGRPLLLQHALRSALVALTHPGHTGHHNLHPDN